MYRWHRVDKDSPRGNLSSVSHIINGVKARSALRIYGHYILGICTKDIHHIAVGIPSDVHQDPTPQVADCSRFCDGYRITGIFLAKDGQYFEKCLQN